MNKLGFNPQSPNQNFPSANSPDPLQSLKSKLGHKTVAATKSNTNQDTTSMLSTDTSPVANLTDAQKIQKINEILLEFQREMNQLRLKRNQALENYVQQFALQKANQILASIKQFFSNVSNRFNTNKK